MNRLPTFLNLSLLLAILLASCASPELSTPQPASPLTPEFPTPAAQFTPLPTRPRNPQENGKQERSGGYVKDNALKGRRFARLMSAKRSRIS